MKMRKAAALVLSGVMAVSLAAGAALITPAPVAKEAEAASADQGNAWGFFEWVKAYYPDLADDVEVAEDILNTSVQNGLTSKGNAGDATSIANMVSSVRIMDQLNGYRISDNNFSGLSKLPTNLPVWTMAMVNANVFKYGMTDYDAPFLNNGWLLAFNGDTISETYAVQKQAYDAGDRDEDSEQTGFYQNIVSDYYEYAAVGVNSDSSKHAQNCEAAVYEFGTTIDDAEDYTGKTYLYPSYSLKDIDVSELNAMLETYISAQSANSTTTEGVPMYRLYYPGNHEHLYTSDVNEKNVLSTQRGWTYEGIGWYAPSTSGTPVYRLFSSGQGDHLYTKDTNEVAYLVQNAGWTYEGIGWYSDDAETVPVYRQFSPVLTTGTHNYTTDVNEKNVICASGAWNDEGIAWYAVAGGSN